MRQFVIARCLCRAGLATYADIQQRRIQELEGGGAAAAADDIAHAALNDGEVGGINLCIAHDISFRDLRALVKQTPFPHELRAQQEASVGDGGIHAHHLQRSNLHLTLTNGEVDGEGVRPGQTGCLQYIVRIGDIADQSHQV